MNIDISAWDPHLTSWLSLVSFTLVMLRTTVVISSSSAPIKIAIKRFIKRILLIYKPKNLLLRKEGKWKLSLYMSTAVRYLGRIFPKVLFIKINNKTKDQIQNWLPTEKYYEEFNSARVKLFTPLGPTWHKILKTMVGWMLRVWGLTLSCKIYMLRNIFSIHFPNSLCHWQQRSRYQ